MTFRSILCPVDFSPHSRAALRHATALAQRFGSTLTVLYVNDPLLLVAAEASYGHRRFLERTRAELARFVGRPTATRGAPAAEIRYAIAVGKPAEQIVRQAKRLRSDLVIIGSHGLSGFRKLFFGSTTEHVLRHATTAVLAVPPNAGRRPPSPQIAIDRVIAPLDLAGEWESDAGRAGAVAALFGADLLLVHVIAPIQTPPWIRSTVVAERRRVDKAAHALERVRTKLFSHQRCETAVVIGKPADEIARLTRRRRSMVVMSLRGTAGVWGENRGSIAYHALTHASTPVLLLPRRRIGGSFAARASRAIEGVLRARDRKEMRGIDALLSAARSGRRKAP